MSADNGEGPKGPYAEMDCPITGALAKKLGLEPCKLGTGDYKGKPTHGKVPGVKRHVRTMHGDRAFDAVTASKKKPGSKDGWPAVRQVEPEPASV